MFYRMLEPLSARVVVVLCVVYGACGVCDVVVGKVDGRRGR